MLAVDDPKTLGRARVSFANAAEADEFVATLRRFEKGEIGPDDWRAFRLTRGTYPQRQEGDAQMLRVKIPQGILDASQLRALAEVAETASRGFGHLTTRQNFQLHFVKLENVEPAMRRLSDAGLTTREACGNSVRNVTACPYAGVSADEVFDVSPYAEALTRHFLRHPLAASLPRKFKAAFEGCPEDHAKTAINDLGFRARLDGGKRGFRLGVGGGTSTKATSGGLLLEFLPASDLLAVAEAVVRVFHRLGDRTNRQKNRLKFLIASLGFDGFRTAFEEELASVRAEGAPPLPFDPDAPPDEEPPRWKRPTPPTVADVSARARAARLTGPGIRPAPPDSRTGTWSRWKATNVRPQRQRGYALVHVTVPLGDLTSEQLRLLGDLSVSYGDGTVRVTLEQNVLLRWVREADLGDLYLRLRAAGLGLDGAGTLADVTSCPGAESCRLAVTHSRGLAHLLGDSLRERPDLVDAAGDLDIKISGCPNGCGQHHVAGLGFQGSVRRLGEKTVPQYFVMVGGGLGESGAHFARLAAKVPARRMPLAVERLVALYRAGRDEGEAASAFFQRVDVARVKAVLADLELLPAAMAEPLDFVDLGAEMDY